MTSVDLMGRVKLFDPLLWSMLAWYRQGTLSALHDKMILTLLYLFSFAVNLSKMKLAVLSTLFAAVAAFTGEPLKTAVSVE